MDNYQQNLFSRGTITFVSENGNEKLEVGNSIVLYQNENYHLAGYILKIENANIELITCKNQKINPNSSNVFDIPVDFKENQFELVLKFKNGVVDDATISVTLKPSDSAAYDKKVAKANNDALIENIKLKVSNGIDLINVMWHKASKDVSKTIVKVVCLNDTESYVVSATESNDEYLKVDALAFGQYKVFVSQFDSKGNLIIETATTVTIENFVDKLSDKLDGVQGQVKASGKHTVCW